MAKSYTKMTPIAVFDISSASVAGAHVLIPKKEQSAPVSVLASSRLFAEPKEDMTVERFVEGTIGQLEKVISTLKKADNHNPDTVQILLASPWFISQTRSIVYTKTTEFVCTQKLIDSLIEKEIAYIIEHDMGQFGEMGKDGIIIEKQISSIKLNGYNTSNPIGKKTQSLELFLVVTVSPKVIIDRFKNTFSKEYAKAQLTFTTSAYATFIVARDFLQAPSEALLIDIGEEITDIACIKNELFVHQYSFPIGIYQFYRILGQSKETSLLESHALMESFKQAKLSAPMTSKVQKALEEFGATWGRGFQQILDSGQNSVKLPENCYLICDEGFSAFFENVLKQDLFLQHAIGSTSYSMTSITQAMLSSHVTSLDIEVFDQTLIIASLFASRLL